MITKLYDFFEFIALNFRINDLIDISIFAAMIFFIFKFMIAKPQRQTLLLLIAFASIFAVTKLLNLTLMAGILKLFFSTIVIFIAIAFQYEISRFFRQFPSILTLKKKSTNITENNIDKVIEISNDLKTKKIGALIVFEGKELIDGLITGGKTLISDINDDLIYSIFSTKTPGHDGAMIIQNNKITHYGCHLPLSKNSRKIKKFGTRHSAALGLAERSDAFILIISEERQMISYAHSGRIFYNITSTKIKEKLETFYSVYSKTEKTNKNIFSFISNNLALQIISLLIAFIAWSITIYEPGLSFKSIKVPVEFINLKQNLVINNISAEEVKVNLSGPTKAIDALEVSNKKLLLDFITSRKGRNIFTQTDFQLDVPRNINIHKFTPNTIIAHLTKYSKVNAEIKPKVIGKIPDDFKIVQTIKSPNIKRVIVPEKMKFHKITLLTKDINIEEIDIDNTTVNTKVILPKGIRLDKSEDLDVSITFSIIKNIDYE